MKGMNERKWKNATVLKIFINVEVEMNERTFQF